jgi:hypothetical protein
MKKVGFNPSAIFAFDYLVNTVDLVTAESDKP